MISMKTLGLAVGIAFAASSFAVAQQTNINAAASGGSGTHQTAQKTGSAANTQKVLRNQQGYRQLSSRHVRSGRLMAYQPAAHKCHMLHRHGWQHAKNCRY
ncbi:MAG TPA: hypothetical protein VFA80_19035 [Xanthobacteraceae bacterium]|nr:hypothetical protein [Xanthobacteraceae bacterium]